MTFARVALQASLALSLTGAAAAADTKVTVGTAKDPNLGAQLVIAQQKGYFREAGLNVEIKYFPSGGDLMAAFVGGSVQLGAAGATPTTTLRSRPYPVEIVARVADISGAQQLVVKRSVNTLDALYGKKIGLLRGTASEALFNSIVKGYGFDPKKVELVNMGPTEMLEGFVRGTVDAVCLWEPHTTRARKAGDGKTLVSGTQSFIPGQVGPKRIYGDHGVLFANEKFIADEPQTIKAFLTALVKANDFIEQNREEAIAILAKTFDLDTNDMSEIVAVNRYTLSLDAQMVSDMDALAAFLFDLKRISGTVKTTDWIDSGPLRSVRADLVKLD